jgi:hypothetical protein
VASVQHANVEIETGKELRTSVDAAGGPGKTPCHSPFGIRVEDVQHRWRLCPCIEKVTRWLWRIDSWTQSAEQALRVCDGYYIPPPCVSHRSRLRSRRAKHRSAGPSFRQRQNASCWMCQSSVETCSTRSGLKDLVLASNATGSQRKAPCGVQCYRETCPEVMQAR